MRKIKLLILLSLFAIAISGCSKGDENEETPTGMTGTWRLTKININLDGSLLTTITPTGFQANLDNASFTYTEDGQKSGTWSINEAETELTINFDSNSSIFPINSKTDTELTFTVETIDLNTALTDDQKALSALINQQLNQSGSNWVTATNGGQTISVVFTLSKF